MQELSFKDNNCPVTTQNYEELYSWSSLNFRIIQMSTLGDTALLLDVNQTEGVSIYAHLCCGIILVKTDCIAVIVVLFTKFLYTL